MDFRTGLREETPTLCVTFHQKAELHYLHVPTAAREAGIASLQPVRTDQRPYAILIHE